MTERLKLSPKHERIVRDVLSSHVPEGTAVRAFGSRVWGKPRPYSDLDLALKGEGNLSLSLFAELAEAFSESDLPFKVDLSEWGSLSPALREAVEREGVEVTLTPAV